MKSHPIAFALLLCSIQVAHSQTFNLIESLPADGDSSVALETTVRFLFDAPIDTTMRFSNGWPVAFFGIEPADSIAIDSLYYNEELTELRLDVRHTPDTYYAWMLTGSVAQDGTALCAPHSLNYTTADRNGELSVSGWVSVVVPLSNSKQAECENNYFYQAPLFAMLMDGDPMEGGKMVRSTRIASPESYDFQIRGVPPGTYWPAAFLDANFDGEFQPNWFLYPSIFAEATYLDPYYPVNDMADGIPDSVVVADTNMTMVELWFAGPGSNEEAAGIPERISMVSAFPNPFRQTTTVAFQLDAPSPVRVTIFDVMGRRVRTLLDQPLHIGAQRITWEGDDDAGRAVAPGLYFCRIIAGNQLKTWALVFLDR